MAIPEQLNEENYFRWFTEIAAIPHGSGNEKQLSDFLVKFAKDRGLVVQQDAQNNVLIKKSVTAGMENVPAVILQGHMDMVCVAEEGYDFDFSKQGLSLLKDGDWIKADRTTLGADNGIAVAYFLALLDADDIPHPALEVIITTEEEVGLHGATQFDISSLTGTYFINLDSEEEGTLCVSCAGGRRCQLSIPAERISVTEIPESELYSFYIVDICGLQGGHSGLEIDKQRGNSNQLLGRVLSVLSKKYPTYLVSAEGGIAANAIPHESSANIFIQASQEEIKDVLEQLRVTFSQELRAADGAELQIVLCSADPSPTVFKSEVLEKILLVSFLLPNGVAAMDLNMTTQRLVESSFNYAMIRTEPDALVVCGSVRSSVGSQKEFLCDRVIAAGRAVGASVTFTGDYPAWEYNPDSRLRELFVESYNALYQQHEPRIIGVHAGLECGIFYEKIKATGRLLDCIAFGPNITGAHTPKERLSISSSRNTWRLLLELLQKIGNEAVLL